MVLVTIDITKTVEQNAAQYYEKAKKLKRKQEGAIQVIKDAKARLAQEIVTIYHGKKAGVEAEKEFEKIGSQAFWNDQVQIGIKIKR